MLAAASDGLDAPAFPIATRMPCTMVHIAIRPFYSMAPVTASAAAVKAPFKLQPPRATITSIHEIVRESVARLVFQILAPPCFLAFTRRGAGLHLASTSSDIAFAFSINSTVNRAREGWRAAEA